MYKEMYMENRAEGNERARKKQNNLHSAERPVQTRQRFAGIPRYLFEYQREAAVSDRSAQFGALSYTQAADRCWNHRPKLAAGKETASGQGVVQGQFVNVKFKRSVYEKKLLEWWKAFRAKYADITLPECGTGADVYNALMEKNEDGVCETYEAIGEKLDSTGEKKIQSQLDILCDLIKHFDKESGGTSGKTYQHYHLYSSDTMLAEGENVGNEANLLAAIDCEVKNTIKLGELDLNKVLWIESFVSFDRGKGMNLLKNILQYDRGNIEHVALGAYPGSEQYYGDRLGMHKLDECFVREEDQKIINQEEALKKVKKEFTWLASASDDKKISEGITGCLFYPVYYATKAELLAKI